MTSKLRLLWFSAGSLSLVDRCEKFDELLREAPALGGIHDG